jgi:heme exporter protein C
LNKAIINIEGYDYVMLHKVLPLPRILKVYFAFFCTQFAAMKKNWWKILSVVLLGYSFTAGMLKSVPEMAILNETIRNLFYHVPMWFGMIILFTVSLVYAIKYLRSNNLKHDIISLHFINVGLLFGVLGLVTGMEWAKFTWGEPWSNDPKQLASAIAMLIYFAVLALRGSIPDFDRRAKIAAVYNVFAFALMIPLLFILPRLTDSLHPGNGGNPGFNTKDLAPSLRPTFYMAVVGWTLMGTWMASLLIRISIVEKRNILNDDIEKYIETRKK